jgi:hypothetical protein
MENANELYEANDKQGKSPGQFVYMKEIKEYLKKDTDYHYQKEGSTYLFSDKLAKLYSLYLGEEEMQTEKKQETSKNIEKDWFELSYEYCKKSLSEENFKYLIDLSYERLLKMTTGNIRKNFGITKLWKMSDRQVKITIVSFMMPVVNEIKQYKKNPDKYFIDRLVSQYNDALSPHLIDDRIFICDDFEVVKNNRLNYEKVAI